MDEIGLDDVVSRTIASLPVGDAVDLRFASDLPSVLADAGLLDRVVAQAYVEEWASNDHFTVDGTLIESYASLKSLRPKDSGVERVGEGILVTFEAGILFDFDSAVVKGSARDNLTQLADHLENNPDTELLVVGHTDAQGTDAYNE